MSGFAAGSRQYINLGKHCFAVGGKHSCNAYFILIALRQYSTL